MKCPLCGNECIDGAIVVGSRIETVAKIQSHFWFPEDQKDKIFIHKKNEIPLKNDPEAPYCEHCEKAFAVFDVKPSFLKKIFER